MAEPSDGTGGLPVATEGNGTIDSASEVVERASKRLKTEAPNEIVSSEKNTTTSEATNDASVKPGDVQKEHVDGRKSGTASIKKEYLIPISRAQQTQEQVDDDDAAEGRGPTSGEQNDRRQDDRDRGGRGGRGKKDKKDKKNKGQNVDRDYGRFDDAIKLCNTRAFYPEFSPKECRFGDKCNLCHDLRKYLAEGRRGDVSVDLFEGKCPVFELYGKCSSGWRCRFVKSHMTEVEHEDGRKELVLVDKTKDQTVSKETGAEPKNEGENGETEEADDSRPGVYNTVAMKVKINLNRKRIDFTKADEYINWMNEESKLNEEFYHRRKDQSVEGIEDLRARYVEPPFKPSEKRRLYFGPETPTLAPLTTQGNLPFRRLAVELGCQLTYSEMAMGMPLLQGAKADWTLMKAHETEVAPPKVDSSRATEAGYDNSRDIRFGAQISGTHPWVVTKCADALSRYCPKLRLIDLNCGCPIDMIFKQGGGSALLEAPTKLERMIRAMNTVSGEIPITAKIRTGVKSNRPTAQKVIGNLAFGGREHRERLGAPGCAAITLHGRSREQRYTKRADWGYIAECAALIKTYNNQKDQLTDTAAEPDPSTLPNTKDGKIFFLGNGDCYSHVDYQTSIETARVDSVMIGRGALIKPWIFEEIEKGQYLDKSASERLTYVEKFVRYGLEAWGSDELGIGFTRRFLLEWLSFTHRYIPIGLLEYLPPNLNDRPPAYRGRNDLETLLASTNYLDWIKISEMYLGPVQSGFKFQPKHKSNAYEAEG